MLSNQHSRLYLLVWFVTLASWTYLCQVSSFACPVITCSMMEARWVKTSSCGMIICKLGSLVIRAKRLLRILPIWKGKKGNKDILSYQFGRSIFDSAAVHWKMTNDQNRQIQIFLRTSAKQNNPTISIFCFVKLETENNSRPLSWFCTLQQSSIPLEIWFELLLSVSNFTNEKWKLGRLWFILLCQQPLENPFCPFG